MSHGLNTGISGSIAKNLVIIFEHCVGVWFYDKILYFYMIIPHTKFDCLFYHHY